MKKNASSEKLASLLRLRSLLLMALLICAMLLALRLLNGSQPDAFFEPAAVSYVVDGDTLYASVNGQRTKLRLLGINTPESVSETTENTPQGRAASDFLKELLPSGARIYLQYDVETLDDYGRTLAYVWLDPDADPSSFEDFQKYNVNAMIYQNTWCQLMNIPPNDLYSDWFEELTPYKGI